jgi:EpsI family protein
VVILLLFWLGSFWRDVPPASQPAVPPGFAAVTPSPRAFAAAALAVVAVSAAWPLYAAYLDAPRDQTPVPGLATPQGLAGWTAEAKPLTDWRPQYLGATTSAFLVFSKDGRTVALYIAQYRDQQRGSELVSSMNSIAGAAHSPWASIGQSSRVEDAGSGPLELRQTRLRSPAQRLLVWDWYRVSGRDLSNPYFAKALLARDKLLGRGDDAAAVVIAAPYAERAEEAQETLRQFVRDMRPSIDGALGGALSRQPL